MLAWFHGWAQAQSASTAEVATPEELQEQVSLGTTHIVITEHLNMADTPLPRSSDSAMLSVIRTDSGITQTVRVRCSISLPARDLFGY